MTSPEEVAVLRQIYDRLFRERVGEAEGLYTEASSDGSTGEGVPFLKIHEIFDLAPHLRLSGFVANAPGVAKQLFGAEVRFLGGRAMMKPPRCQQRTPWHQDPADPSTRPDLPQRQRLAGVAGLPGRGRSDALRPEESPRKRGLPSSPP